MNNRLYVGAFTIAVLFITYEEIKECHDLPWPPRIVGTGIVFTFIYSFGLLVSERLSDVFAVGFLLAAIISKGFKFNKAHDCEHADCATNPSTATSFQAFSGQPGTQLA